MATLTHNTGVSRRSILTGTAASALPAIMPLPGAGAEQVPGTDPDDGLLRRLAEVERCWAAFVEAREETDRLFRVTYNHPEFRRPWRMSKAGRLGFDAVARRTGYRAAADRSTRLHDLYLEKARMAFAMPAHGLPGVAAKIRFGVAVARDGFIGAFADNEFEWLDLAIDDFERLIGSGPRLG